MVFKTLMVQGLDEELVTGPDVSLSAQK